MDTLPEATHLPEKSIVQEGLGNALCINAMRNAQVRRKPTAPRSPASLAISWRPKQLVNTHGDQRSKHQVAVYQTQEAAIVITGGQRGKHRNLTFRGFRELIEYSIPRGKRDEHPIR